jgi:hypothetical protein
MIAELQGEEQQKVEEPTQVLTRAEFCRRNKISLSTLHQLNKRGAGPAIMLVGTNSIRITFQAEREWQRAREKEYASAARQLERERQSARMSQLGKRGAASPEHPQRKRMAAKGRRT